MVRVAVLVSGGGTNLQAILDSVGTVITSAQIALVISSSEKAYALTRAENYGVASMVIKKEDELNTALSQHGIDLIVLAGYMKILSEEFTAKWSRRIINVHPSLIPSFCGKGMYGLRVHEAALSYGVKVSGATVHFVNEIPDGGEIIFQKAVDVIPGDTPETLQRRIMEQAEWILLPKAIEQVAKEIENAKLS
ncbi:MAG: phosphoribosylglycinamide formyltransferase [Ruminococcaceae bacterium]|nr:phosphoribosylglycinamide formyltransferase [Oscillospiraceae bacterium]